MAARIQVRRDTLANWLVVNPILAQGEIGYILDSKEIVVGDGSTSFSNLPRFASGTSASTLLIVEQNVYNDLKTQLESTLNTTMDTKITDFMTQVSNYDLDLTSLVQTESFAPELILAVKNDEHTFLSWNEPYHKMEFDPTVGKFKFSRAQTNSEVRTGTIRPYTNLEGNLLSLIPRGTKLSESNYQGFSWSFQEPSTQLANEGIKDILVLNNVDISGPLSLFVNYQNESKNEIFWDISPQDANIAGFGWNSFEISTILEQY